MVTPRYLCHLSFLAQRQKIKTMQFSVRSIIVAFVGVLGLLTATTSIHAQEDPKPNPDPNVFKAQLLQFTQLTRRNLREIQALPADDSIPLDPGLRSSTRQAYILIRAARWGMDLALQRQANQDPILLLAHKRVEE